MLPNKTYIIIELDQTENAGDVMNVLMTHSKAQFTVTKDIMKYATERTESHQPHHQIKKSESKNTSIDEAQCSKDNNSEVNNHCGTNSLEFGDYMQNPSHSHQAPPKRDDRKRGAQDDSSDMSHGYDFDHFLNSHEHPNPHNSKRQNYGSLSSAANGLLEVKPEIEQQGHLMYNYDTISDNDSNQNGDDVFNSYNFTSSLMQDDVLISDEPTSSSPVLTYSHGRKVPVESFRCAVCSSYIKTRGMDYYKRSAHAIIHTDIMRYKCPLEPCTFKNRHRADCVRHLKMVHQTEPQNVKIQDCMSVEQRNELRRVTLKCFPELSARKGIEPTEEAGPEEI